MTMRPLLTILALLLVFGEHASARSSEVFLEVLEVIDHVEDPMALEEYGLIEMEAEALQRRIQRLRRDVPTDAARRTQHREQIQSLTRRRSELLRQSRLTRARIGAGMCEVKGWDGMRRRVIRIECRGMLRDQARRLTPGTLITCTFESSNKTSNDRSLPSSVRHAVSIRGETGLPPIWNDAPASAQQPTAAIPATDLSTVTGGVEQELDRYGHPSLVVFVNGSRSGASGGTVTRSVVHVYMLDANGGRASRLTGERGLVLRRSRYGWGMASAHSTTSVATSSSKWQASARLDAPGRAPRGGYEVDILEAWVRP